MESVGVEAHPLALIFPPMEDDEYKALADSIFKNGQREFISVWKGKILDGVHRYRACMELGIVPKYEILQFDNEDEAVQFVLDKNLHRRHLSVGQRALIAAEMTTATVGGYRRESDSANSQSEVTESDAADRMNIGTRAVAEAKRVSHSAIPEVVDEVRKGKVALNDAYKVSILPENVQKEAINRVKSKENQTLQSAVNQIRKDELAENPPELPTGKYATIVIDPPWPIEKITTDARPNQTDMDYPIMTLDEIKALPVADMVADDCWIFLWITQKFFWQGREMLEHWGLEPQSWFFTWVKNQGLPVLFESPKWNCEYVLVGKKGKPIFVSKKGLVLGFEDIAEKHSRKPAKFYEMLLNSTISPRLDMFSRREIEGFNAWGIENDRQSSGFVGEGQEG